MQIRKLKAINKKTGLPLSDIQAVRLMSIGRRLKGEEEEKHG
jgi:hypothetical protein